MNGGMCYDSSVNKKISGATSGSSAMKMSVDNKYVDTLYSGSALSDGKLTANELLSDPEGAALLKSLQSQIAGELGITASSVSINSLKVTKGTRRALTSSVDDVDDLDPELEPLTAQPLDQGYFTVPSSNEQEHMSPSELSAVKNFKVGRIGFGQIEWLDDVDIRRIDVFDVVRFGRAVVNVYDSKRAETTKPTLGHGLNKPAEVTLENVLAPKGVEGFETKLRESIEASGSEFLSYDTESGKLRFRVEHW
jgi:hypothetical protein